MYEAFRDLGEDKAKILAEFVEYVESKKAATSEELRETELRLQGEIEQVRKELRETELRLQKEIEGVRLEIEQVRKELKETELRLQKEIEGVKVEIQRTRADIIKWMIVFWAGQLASWTALLIGVLKWIFHF